MYIIVNKMESIFKLILNKIQIFYFKLKYGKRLKIGKRVRFRKGFRLFISDDGYVEIGNNCFFNNFCTIDCMGKIIIQEHNLFGENVKLYDHNHLFDKKTVNRGTNYKIGKITIGNNNWIGTGVIVLKNVVLGNNNVIGAGTVLSGEFKDDLIVTSQSSKKYNIKEIQYIEEI